MRKLEKVAEDLERPAKESDVHWEGSGSPEPAPEACLTHRSRLRPQLLPSSGLTLLSSKDTQDNTQAWTCVSEQDPRPA